MATALDFDVMTQEIVDAVLESGVEEAKRKIAEYLKLTWNARGAADIAKIGVELSAMIGSTAAGPYVKGLDRALRKLDR